eukprot:1156390-Pelagomonas_calceolata.AAC.1
MKLPSLDSCTSDLGGGPFRVRGICTELVADDGTSGRESVWGKYMLAWHCFPFEVGVHAAACLRAEAACVVCVCMCARARA